MKFKSCLVALLLGFAFFTAGAQAAYVQLAPGPQANDGSIDLPPAGFSATYSPFSSISSIWFNGSVSPQSPTSVAASITSQFGGSLALVAQNDSFSSGTISLASGSFDVLAVHLGGSGGGNELLFFFNAPVSSFDVMTFSQGGSNNLSNFRAYSTGVVPVPAAVWMFASGLGALLGRARRKRRVA